MYVDRSLVEKSVKKDGIRCDIIVKELEKMYTKECKEKDREKSKTVESIIQELKEFKITMCEPYETARILALVVEAFHTLAIIHTKLYNNEEQASLRYQKDNFMKELTFYCKLKDIYMGMWQNEKSNQTLEIEIPFIGQVGWDFGRKTDLYDYTFCVGVKNYGYLIEPKISQSGKKYTNANLLICELNPDTEMNWVDRNLVRYGMRNPER